MRQFEWEWNMSFIKYYKWRIEVSHKMIKISAKQSRHISYYLHNRYFILYSYKKLVSWFLDWEKVSLEETDYIYVMLKNVCEILKILFRVLLFSFHIPCFCWCGNLSNSTRNWTLIFFDIICFKNPKFIHFSLGFYMILMVAKILLTIWIPMFHVDTNYIFPCST